MKKLLLTSVILVVTACATEPEKQLPLETVESVNLDRYLGKWYEIARFEHSFQKDCIESEANYSKTAEGYIRVVNKCREDKPGGKIKEAKARAWVIDNQTNAKLKVQFFLSQFKIPLFAGSYWIIELDKSYQYAVIGEPSRNYLWILSRTKKMDEATYDMLVKKAQAKLFDTSKLIKAGY